uniref:Uncharacterized protein n=1 Tax=Glossina brevipalpis TaxID=37001 RepID=A0A1A9WWH3_9MUSC
MTSFSHKFNPRANVFILVNLGCEMLYVIDQRLKAQQIPMNKSIQVIHDVTAVLLDPKFLDSLIIGSTQPTSQLFSESHCKFMLKDIATCSLMQLNSDSMDKLWNLMTMVYKWQLYLTRHQHHLLDITFRHLDSIANLYTEEKRSFLIDFTKNTLLDFWNSCNDDEQLSIYRTNKAWLEFFNTKISLLIRLGFQTLDGNFIENVHESYFHEFRDTIGENIYIKSIEIAKRKRQELEEEATVSRNTGSSSSSSSRSSANCVNQLMEMLNYNSFLKSDDQQATVATDVQKQFEQNLEQCNILFEDLGFNGDKKVDTPTTTTNIQEFVSVETSYNQQNDSHFTVYGPSNGSQGFGKYYEGSFSLNKDLLDFYGKMN